MSINKVRPITSTLLPTFLLAFALILLCPDIAEAGYLDPGSGSSLVQGIIATIAASKRIWNNILNKISSVFGGGNKDA